jgi:hypothetical protein
VVLNAAMRAIQQAIELIGDPTDERMRAVRRVLRGAVIVAEDAGEVAPRKARELERVLVDQLRAFADATYALRASQGQAPAGATKPTEQQILEAAEKAGLWPNTVHSWIPAFHRYHKELAKAQPAQARADSVLEDAARWREHVGKLDALVAYCPTCCQGFIAKQDMTRDEVLFACGKAVGQSGAKRLREALDLAVDHIDMDALRISHCKDAAAIDAARKQGENHGR